MHITNVEARGLKERDFSYALGKLTAIVGPNFSGKTAIIEAIRLALIGYIPELGKRASSTLELASEQVMAVEVHFDNDSAITRTFTDGKAALHTNAGKKPLDWIGDEFLDDNGGFTLPLLNAEHYFSLTDKERTAYVFERVKLPDSYTAESIIAQVERLSFEEKHSEQVETAKAEFVITLRSCFQGTHPMQDKRDTPTIQEALSDAVAVFKAAFTYWNKRATETVSAARLMTELKNRESEVSAVSLDELERNISAAEKELGELNRQKGAVGAALLGAQTNAKHIAQLEKWLAEPRIDYPHMIAKVQALIVEAKVKLVGLMSRQELAELTAARDRADRLLVDLRGNIDTWKRVIADSEKQLSELPLLTACPYCHAEGADSRGVDWKRYLTADLEAASKRCAQSIQEAELEYSRVKKEREALTDRIAAAEKAQSSNAEIEQQVAMWERDIVLKTQQQTEQDAKYARYQQELETRRGNQPDFDPEQPTLQEIESKITGVQKALAELDASRRKATQLQQDLRRAAEAQIEHMDAAAHLLVVKAIRKLIEETRETMIADVFGTLLTTANTICGRILKSPLALHEGVVGRWAGAKFVPHRVFSGVEKALAYVSIAAALSSQAPFKLLILDETGRMTRLVRWQVMAALEDAVGAGVLDQVIAVIPSDTPSMEKVSDQQWMWSIIQTS